MNANERRQQHTQQVLGQEKLLTCPIAQFQQWYKEFEILKPLEASALTLATANKQGQAHARTVLLKSATEAGFVFFTNQQSQKAQDLKDNPYATLHFSWLEQARQITISGAVKLCAEEENDNYFSSRPRESQLGAWASLQSQELDSRDTLITRFHEYEEKFRDQKVPRPPHWGGYLVVPERIEFWQAGEFRLHDRFAYHRKNESAAWELTRYHP